MPTHDQLLADLLDSRLDIDGLIQKHNLTPAQLRAFARDPEVVETLRLYEDLRARRQRILTEERQSTAAEHLHNAILDAKGPEIRRTAAALTAVCRIRPTPPPKPRRATGRDPAENSPASPTTPPSPEGPAHPPLADTAERPAARAAKHRPATSPPIPRLLSTHAGTLSVRHAVEPDVEESSCVPWPSPPPYSPSSA